MNEKKFRQTAANADDAAHLARHRVLLCDGIRDPVGRAADHLECHGGDEQAEQKHAVSRVDEGHGAKDQRSRHSEHDEMRPVASSKRAPAVPDEAEYEPNDQRSADPELEHGQFVGIQMHPVLQEESDRDVDDTARRTGEIHQDQQDPAEQEGLARTHSREWRRQGQGVMGHAGRFSLGA